MPDLRCAARLREDVRQGGRDAEAALARQRAARIKDLANKLFWNDKGYYIFAIDTKTHQRLHEAHTSVYADGYAILFGLADGSRAEAILDYLESWDYQVPGPILIPPLTQEGFANSGNKLHFPPGVYANGGCGWGRGHLPSATLASFRTGRVDVGLKHIRAMANAANRETARSTSTGRGRSTPARRSPAAAKITRRRRVLTSMPLFMVCSGSRVPSRGSPLCGLRHGFPPSGVLRRSNSH